LLRFYYGKEKRLEGRLMHSTYEYGWEFLQGPHLIPILSTMRCYRALVTAHAMGTFLNLQGPACCGKSSTFFSLAVIFGRFKIAVTCSPSMTEFALLRVRNLVLNRDVQNNQNDYRWEAQFAYMKLNFLCKS
jgi:Hydrolytic ATP binding site of dynein motor region